MADASEGAGRAAVFSDNVRNLSADHDGDTMTLTLFTGGRFLDPERTELIDGIEVLIEDGRVREVSDRPIASASATRVDLKGLTLMPGLIDAHVHVIASLVDLGANAMLPNRPPHRPLPSRRMPQLLHCCGL
jgi:adenine deaminase